MCVCVYICIYMNMRVWTGYSDDVISYGERYFSPLKQDIL